MVLKSLFYLPLALLLPFVTTLGNESFDYIVVGGGTSGVTIASRLAQSNHVALIEAGAHYEITWPFAAIPGADVLPVGSDPESNFPADWKFVTSPQAGANGREIHFARGKCLGGSSVAYLLVLPELECSFFLQVRI